MHQIRSQIALLVECHSLQARHVYSLWHDCVNPASFPPICFPIPEVLPHSCYILPFARNNVNHDQKWHLLSQPTFISVMYVCKDSLHIVIYSHFIHSLINCMPCYGRRFQWYALRFECNAIWFVCYAMRYWNKRLHYVVHYFMFCCEIWKKTTPTYTENVHTIRSKIIFKKHLSLSLIFL